MIEPAQRRFLFLLSVLAALLGVCLLFITKAFVEHAAFRNALGSASLVLLVPIIYIGIDTLVSAAFDTGLGLIEIHAPKWVYKLTLALIFFVSVLWLADEIFEISWPW